jgi:hypothetical protein
MSMLYMSNGRNWIRSWGLCGSSWNIDLNTTLPYIYYAKKYIISFSHIFCTPHIFFEALSSFCGGNAL